MYSLASGTALQAMVFLLPVTNRLLSTPCGADGMDSALSLVRIQVTTYW